MQNIAEFVNSAISNYHIDSSSIQNVQGCLGKEMKVDGWVSLKLRRREYVALKFNNGVFMNEGFVVNDQKVMKVFGNHQFGDMSYNEGVVEKGIVDLDHGSRFEGSVLKDEKVGKMGIPFGYGEMYDDNGLLLYKGIMINWKRFGYGTSYHDNGLKEYEGSWCDDNRFGIGKVYDRSGNLVKVCKWCNGIESDFDSTTDEEYDSMIDEEYDSTTDEEYDSMADEEYDSMADEEYDSMTDEEYDYWIDEESDYTTSKVYDYSTDFGNGPIRIGVKKLQFRECVDLPNFDISLLYNLRYLIIGGWCFKSVKLFKIDGLNRLITIKIGNESFTSGTDKEKDQSKSFHIMNCKSLKSITIGPYAFHDYAGDFELKNLPSLKSLDIGDTEIIDSGAYNFYYSSFVVRGFGIIIDFKP